MAENRVLFKHQVCHQRGNILGELMCVGGVVSHQYFRHASDFRSGFSDGTHALACNQHVNVATDLRSGSHGVQGGRSHDLVVVFGDYQDSHSQITFASFFSFSTSSATDLTLIPALRASGSCWWRRWKRPKHPESALQAASSWLS